MWPAHRTTPETSKELLRRDEPSGHSRLETRGTHAASLTPCMAADNVALLGRSPRSATLTATLEQGLDDEDGSLLWRSGNAHPRCFGGHPEADDPCRGQAHPLG